MHRKSDDLKGEAMNNVPTAAVPAIPKADEANNVRETAQVQDQRRVMLHMPVDVRSVSLAIIATISILYALQWAKEIVVPILMGVLVSYSLTPVVDKLERWRIPRSAAATALLSLILAMAAWGAFALSDQTDALLETVPKVTEKVREMAARVSGKASTIDKVQRAAAQLAAAADASASGPSASSAPDGHFKFPHLWPLKLPRAGPPDYESEAVLSAMREAASLRR